MYFRQLSGVLILNCVLFSGVVYGAPTDEAAVDQLENWYKRFAAPPSKDQLDMLDQRVRNRTATPREIFLVAMAVTRGLIHHPDESVATLLRAAADKNYLPAKAKLGCMEVIGEGVTKNTTEGRELLSIATKANCAEGLFFTAGLFLNGVDQNISEDEALEYFNRAAELGLIHAYVGSASIYAHRLNFTASLESLAKSAESNDPEAQTRLSEYYERGVGIPCDSDLAFKWALRAATNGRDDGTGARRLAQIYAFRQGQESDQSSSTEWYKKGSERGDLECKFQLGLRTLYGIGVPMNISDGRRMVEEAASNGYAPAQARLAQAYLEGIWVSRDVNKAISWLKAASKTIPEADETLKLIQKVQSAPDQQ